jgi:MoaA/NifB/PqqE/SkfB family radical SAM enzyme
MDLVLFDKIVKELENYPDSVLRIHSVGEPLLWSDLGNALDLIKKLHNRSWIFSCAITGDTSILKKLCENLGIIEVSVNSINPTDYIKTKGVDLFDHVVRNIRFMSGYIKSNNLSARLIVSRVESENEELDKEFIKFWKESGFVDDAFIRSFHSYNNLIINSQPQSLPFKKFPCLVHWSRFNIGYNGNAIVCFNELFKRGYNEHLVYGNINEISIKELWDGDKINSIRKAELNSDYTLLSFSGDIPCRNCVYCQSIYGNEQTSEFQTCQIISDNVKTV